jgi:hypothetical protein
MHAKHFLKFYEVLLWIFKILNKYYYITFPLKCIILQLIAKRFKIKY